MTLNSTNLKNEYYELTRKLNSAEGAKEHSMDLYFYIDSLEMKLYAAVSNRTKLILAQKINNYRWESLNYTEFSNLEEYLVDSLNENKNLELLSSQELTTQIKLQLFQFPC